jgi:hypothetical protein
MNPPDTVTTLTQAKALLVERGWQRGPLGFRQGGPICVAMALRDLGDPTQAYTALTQTWHCRRHREVRAVGSGIVQHSDECLASEAEAFDWLDRAIRYAKDHETQS